MKKILYFDVETTGINPTKNDIVQISGLIEINGEVKEEFNLRARPIDFGSIEVGALETTGLTIEDLKNYPESRETFSKLLSIFNKYINKFDKNDKFYPAGYNVRFDLDFLQNFFLKNGERYGSGSWQNWRAIDGLAMSHLLDYMGILNLDNYKLGTLCKHFGIEIQAHDALSDIRATRELLLKFKELVTIKNLTED